MGTAATAVGWPVSAAAMAKAGPVALAAGQDQVAGDLGEERVVGGDGVAQLVLDAVEVVGERSRARRRRADRERHGRAG